MAQGLDAVTADVKTRAPRERVAELEFVLSQARHPPAQHTLPQHTLPLDAAVRGPESCVAGP